MKKFHKLAMISALSAIVTTTFDPLFERLMDHEGGYVNHPSDPGGETMWGVTKRVAVAHG